MGAWELGSLGTYVVMKWWGERQLRCPKRFNLAALIGWLAGDLHVDCSFRCREWFGFGALYLYLSSIRTHR
jgi:hypothetical protein